MSRIGMLVSTRSATEAGPTGSNSRIGGEIVDDSGGNPEIRLPGHVSSVSSRGGRYKKKIATCISEILVLRTP